MIIIITILLLGTIGFLIRTNQQLKKFKEKQHITTNSIRTELAGLRKEIELLHETFRETEIEVKERIKNGDVSIIEQVTKSIDKVRSEIPRTNDDLLAEVQKMRDDFLALRQNL